MGEEILPDMQAGPTQPGPMYANVMGGSLAGVSGGLVGSWSRVAGARAPIFEWYDVELPLPDDGNFRSTCKICKTSISASRRATSNLISHMKRKHPGVYADNVGQRYQIKTERPVSQSHSQGEGCFSSDGPNGIEGSVTSHGSSNGVHGPIVDTHSRAIGALVDFLANSLTDPKMVDSTDFRRFVHTLNPGFDLPSSLHLSYSYLPSKRWGIQQRMMQLLQEVEYVAITQDVWTNASHQSVACLSAHFVHDWKLKMVFLASKHFTLPDIKTNLAELFEDTISYYNLSQKVSHTLTNNATKLARSAKTSLPGFLSEDLELTDSPSTSQEGASIDLKDMNSVFLEGMACFAEALESCVMTATKDNSFLESVLCKVSAVVDYIRTIVFPSPALEELRVVLERGYSTWNLQLRIVRAIANTTHERLQNALSGVKSLSHEDYAVLTELVELLEPFEEAYNLYREGHKVTASYVIPCIRGLKVHLQNIKTVHLGPVVEKLSQFIHTNLAKYEANETYALCSILDPRFKLAWCPEERQCSLITLLCRKASEQRFPETVTSCNAMLFQGEERRSKLFQFMSPQTSKKANSVHSVEVGSYLAMPCLPDSAACCPLEFWRQNQGQFPSLCQLARSLMNIPAAATQVLLMSRIQNTDTVANLADLTLNSSTFESLMFIKVNNALIRL
ncbi:zinc finger BED domain-containing protein 1-like [Varroa jacobsoni]|uniref:BED-type domain-containing protein n=1 Tax=Varroa destructor TaxID=109461 RepID=A0A7M7JJV5_VARDE|nr:zinc finger BED domain-containing protein 1-like [Varroa destructor]XP_022687862.1 zinc finger BED domain-containing protein 1-like [Varroa jacobsoni]